MCINKTFFSFYFVRYISSYFNDITGDGIKRSKFNETRIFNSERIQAYNILIAVLLSVTCKKREFLLSTGRKSYDSSYVPSLEIGNFSENPKTPSNTFETNKWKQFI